MFTRTRSVQFTSGTHQHSLQYTHMSRFTQRQGNKIDCWIFLLIPDEPRNYCHCWLKHGNTNRDKNDVKKIFFFLFLFFYCANMLVSIPIYHAIPVRSSVRFIGQTVVLHGWGCREQRCVVFESLRQVLVTWLYTSSVIVSLLLTQMIRVKPENGTRFVTLGGGEGGGAAQIAGAA